MRKQGDVRAWVRNNAVTVMFVLLCIICIIYSGQSMSYVIYEMFGRLSRNAFIVLALIIPIVAGMGINFAITIGAMAAQIAILWVLEWQIPGIGGFLVAALMPIPIASLFGFLIGKLLNKMKGQEMIGGMILGYFANGLYQLLFLFIFQIILVHPFAHQEISECINRSFNIFRNLIQIPLQQKSTFDPPRNRVVFNQLRKTDPFTEICHDRVVLPVHLDFFRKLLI